MAAELYQKFNFINIFENVEVNSVIDLIKMIFSLVDFSGFSTEFDEFDRAIGNKLPCRAK